MGSLGTNSPIASETPQPHTQIVRIAARQHNNVTRAQLNAIGLNDQAIAHRVRTGRLFRIHRGVFSVGRPATTALERASAAVFACGSGAALSHSGALALWGFIRRWPATFDVTVTQGDPRPQGITVHRATHLTRRDLRTQLGIRATSPARTILDCLASFPEKPRIRLVNDALHTPFLTQFQLADVRQRFPRHPGAKWLDPFLDATTGPTRSPLEDDFETFCRRHGLPRPQINVRVAGHEVDALFAAQRLIVEVDGWEFHHDRHAFESDRDRDADTLAAGHATVRITSKRFQKAPEAEADRLRRILAQRGPN